jgi:hypothetical protein
MGQGRPRQEQVFASAIQEAYEGGQGLPRHPGHDPAGVEALKAGGNPWPPLSWLKPVPRDAMMTSGALATHGGPVTGLLAASGIASALTNTKSHSMEY